MAIIVREGESLDDALRRFKREVARNGVMEDLKKHECYVKPSVKRKLKQQANAKRMAKKKGRY